jgi:hypothetical protein
MFVLRMPFAVFQLLPLSQEYRSVEPLAQITPDEKHIAPHVDPTEAGETMLHCAVSVAGKNKMRRSESIRGRISPLLFSRHLRVVNAKTIGVAKERVNVLPT